MYIYFFFGREDLHGDAGELEGPTIGPVDDIQLTYLSEIRLWKEKFNGERVYEFIVEEDMVKIGNVWYADFTITRKCPNFSRGKNVSIADALEKGWIKPFM